LFKNELEGFVTDESLSRLVTAFSRYEEQRVVYVQHRMMDPEHAAQIADVMLKQDGVLYLCGDAKGMARGVREALVEILKKHGNMTEQEANDTILSWNKSKRYMLDIWA
jgi:methionine synthase reductase